MNKHNPYIIRRTISQERFEVLWKKRRDGEATLRDLTEMDEIINRDPSVRQFVLEEMENDTFMTDNNDPSEMSQPKSVKPVNGFINRIKAFFNRAFNSFATARLVSTATY
ncbi:hypothetical protein [Mucilaginibacter sp. AK015]|uniref:hypothetical protein n=1 Tax=Mucilaginibacter sp. AK015 TaxID=2723072 RepID=UPI00160CE6BE|nr:hypothetical protein [Mucilaginibacter sp. AK015]MBB5394357.1 hypothetical protein [Mucilaginibacter sp. AK015]